MGIVICRISFVSLIFITWFLVVSFPQCFAAEFTPLCRLHEGGVPLEHLISCVSGVQISASKGGCRKVLWAENRRFDGGKLLRFVNFMHTKLSLLIC